MSEQPQRETWRDWLPEGVTEPRVISRAELLDELAERGVEVAERTLRWWETRGALPHAVRQYHEDGGRAVYPEWQADVVAEVADLRSRVPLRVVLALARGIFTLHAQVHSSRPLRRRTPDAAHEKPLLPESLKAALLAYLAAYGGGTLRVDVQLHDGRRHSCWVERLPSPPTDK